MPSLQRASRNQLLFPEFEFLEKKKKKKILELEKKVWREENENDYKEADKNSKVGR